MSGMLIPHWLWSSPDLVPDSYPNTICKWEVWSFVALSCLMLCSCEFNDYVATSGSGQNMVRERNIQLGGTKSSSRSDGSSYANNYENSLRDTANAVGVAVGLKYSYKTRVTDNELSKVKVKANTTPVPQQIVPEGSIAVPQGSPPQQ